MTNNYKNQRDFQVSSEEVAVRALAFLTAETDRLAKFLAFSGLDPAHIRDLVDTPDFQAGVLDYLMQDETLLLAFAENNGLAPEAILAAHARLHRSRDTTA